MVIQLLLIVVCALAITAFVVHAFLNRGLGDLDRMRKAAQEADDALRELTRLNSLAASALEKAADHLATK